MGTWGPKASYLNFQAGHPSHATRPVVLWVPSKRPAARRWNPCPGISSRCEVKISIAWKLPKPTHILHTKKWYGFLCFPGADTCQDIYIYIYFFFAAVGFYKVCFFFFQLVSSKSSKLQRVIIKFPSLAGESFNTQIFLFSFLDSRGSYTAFWGGGTWVFLGICIPRIQQLQGGPLPNGASYGAPL